MEITPKTKEIRYVDFPTNFDFHPIRKDLALLTNENAVSRSLRNIILTNFYERNDPTVGTNLSDQLFELATKQTQIVLRDAIRAAILNHEPRVNIISIDVAVSPESHEVFVTISFSIINTNEQSVLTVLLNRVR
jgi:phage baseplate assembly protein W